MISIIIATKNRAQELKTCIQSIERCTYAPHEIIIVDQSASSKVAKLVLTKHNKHIHYLHSAKIGKSNALNEGISYAKGDIVAFTDDDCIVDALWIQTIQRLFSNKKVMGVFGKTLPYAPIRHTQHICPSTFNYNKSRWIRNPAYHATNIGFGNNMAFRKSIFRVIGNFNILLGPGSAGQGAEDAEFSLRVLIHKVNILYSPSMLIYHNKWLTKNEMHTLNASYICGEMACYTYFALRGYAFAKNVIKKNFYQIFNEMRYVFSLLKKHKTVRDLPQYIHDYVIMQISRFRGTSIGLYIYILYVYKILRISHPA